MKKLFLLIPAFLLSLAASAATTNVDPGTGTLSAAITAASDGDILVLADGTYTETALVAISKQLTIRAAENATPVVHQNTNRMTVNDEITIIGVTFESGHSNELLSIATTAADKTITIRNCTFRSAGYGVRVRESECQQLENIVIDNCVFENIEARAIYAEKRTTAAPGVTKAISITNSTFAACGKSGSHTPTIEIHDDDENPATAGPVTLIDHCTFYNCSPSQYTIYLPKIGPQATVSNCIVSNPSVEQASTAYHGYDNFNITNCLWYNCSSFGFRTPATSANIINSDPLFADAANGDFSLAGDFINENVSPARNAGTDGSDLGDPRWYTPVTYPSTDFAAPGYACSADAATIPTGVYGLSLYTESEPHYIICSSVAYNTLLGTWAITATRACYVTVGLDLGPEVDNNKHIFEVKILDKDGNPVGSLSEDPADPTGATENNTEANQLKTMDGSILIPAAGDYTIELRNLRGPGKGSIKNIILTYDGDAPITDFAAPGYTFLAKRAELAGNIEYNTTTATPYIQYTDNSDPGTATWIVTATRACQVKVAMNMVDNSAYSSGNGKHRFVVELLEGNVVKSYVEETSEVDENGRTFPRSYDMPGYITIPAAGDYTIRVRNPRERSRCGLASITLTYSYEGGDVINIATATNTTLDVADAWYSDCTRDNDKTYIQYPSSGTSSAWIKWNIATSETKYYDLTVNVNTTYAHGFTVAIYEDEEASPVASVTEGSYVNTKGDGLALEVGRVNLVGGKNYVVKVTNAPPGSQAKVTSVVFAPVVASSTALPNTLEFSNAVLSEKANITDGMLYFNEPGADKDPLGQWAQWSVTTDHEGLFLFTMGATSTNGQNYKITIKDDGDNVLDYYETSLDSGDKTVTHYFALSAGNYFVKVENTRSFSKGHLTSLVVTEPAGVVTIDESATDNTAWADKVVDKNAEGPLYDVQIIRSFKGGMNNTFCLPFAVSSSQCKEVFGNDVEIYTLGKATIEDYILNLTVNSASDIYPGTPVLIKPARDIVNPVFTDVKFTAATASATTKTNADFVGSFVKTPLTANDDLLYVGPENKVFFLSVDYDMPGMRAWFEIHDVPAALGSPKALRSARIIEKEQITTSILNVETSGDAARKVLYNGQIVIIRGNEMYNMQGQHIQ